MLDYLASLFGPPVILTIMFIIYKQSSQPIGKNSKELIVKELFLVFSKKEDLEALRLEHDKRKQFERKQKIYTEMANQQIDEVLTAMVSIGKISVDGYGH